MAALVNNLRAARPTIKDVARLANVSQSTVSYILNNNHAAQRISQGTKARVWRAVERLGYKRNPLGRALQRGYSDHVTLLIVTWNLATSHAATAMALSRAASRHDLAFTVHVADDDASAETFVQRTSLHNLGGVLVLWDSPAFQRSALRQIAAEGVPIVDLLPDSPEGISVVTADREDAGYRATRHLIQLGHRSIGFIGDTTTRPQTTLSKLAGYRRALVEAGLPHDEALVQNVTEFGFEGGEKGFPELIARAPAVSSIFCINDAIALGVISAARDRGRECPKDLSVIGFGDAPEGRYWRPKLTTFALSSERVAEQALKEVIRKQLEPAAVPQIILIPEELILRESTSRTPSPAWPECVGSKSV